MNIKHVDVAVVGGGAAGMAAALRAKKAEIENVAIFEWASELGGILPQCIHPGFGLDYFKENLSGPEFIQRFIDKVGESRITVMTDSTVIELEAGCPNKLLVSRSKLGLEEVRAKTVILTTGCRERGRFNLNLSGDRCAGIFTAGTAQRLMDIDGIMPGKRIVVLGSGDVGLIMARRFAQEGAEVKGVFEIMPYPGGLQRNVVQCLEDYGIPLYLGKTVIEVRGKKRVESVIVADVDENFNIISDTKTEVKCDTLILSAGLVPDWRLPRILPPAKGIDIDDRTSGPVVNDLLETNMPKIFAAGNFLMVNDTVDDVTFQGELAGESAAESIKFDDMRTNRIEWRDAVPGEGIRFVVPQKFSGKSDVRFYLRVKRPMEKVWIEIPEIGKRFFKKIVRPAEMIKIDLKSEDIDDAPRLSFNLSVLKRRGKN